jgi:branched-chain amino acid aminotransferase
MKPVSLYCDDNFTRSWPGSVGDKQVGGNYGPTIKVRKAAAAKGYQNILWTYKDQATESGGMNFFVFWKNKQGEDELITAALNGAILPGITRDSILQLGRSWGEFKVTEGNIHMSDLVEAANEGRIYEAFGCSTAEVITPVEKINYKGTDYTLPRENGNRGRLAARFCESLQSIHYGDTKYPEWQHYIDEMREYKLALTNN